MNSTSDVQNNLRRNSAMIATLSLKSTQKSCASYFLHNTDMLLYFKKHIYDT